MDWLHEMNVDRSLRKQAGCAAAELDVGFGSIADSLVQSRRMSALVRIADF
jgi:hypothetical protein